MTVMQKRPKRKPSGSRYRPFSKKKQVMLGAEPTLTLVGPVRQKVKRGRGGSVKRVLLAAQKANVFSQKTKKFVVADITSVIESPANRNFVRRNIMTRGAIIQTSAGKARVTSRPGQGNVVNAVLLE